MDVDNSGLLSKDELADGFSALGVKLSDQVQGQLMKVRADWWTGIRALEAAGGFLITRILSLCRACLCPQLFDKNGNGTVDFDEFVRTLFPK